MHLLSVSVSFSVLLSFSLSCSLARSFSRSFICQLALAVSGKSKFNYSMRVTRNLIKVQNFRQKHMFHPWNGFSASPYKSNLIRKSPNGFLINEYLCRLWMEQTEQKQKEWEEKEEERKKKRRFSKMFGKHRYQIGRFDNIRWRLKLTNLPPRILQRKFIWFYWFSWARLNKFAGIPDFNIYQ